MIDVARWISAITLTGLAVFQTWVVLRGFGHQLVQPVFRYGAYILWITAIFRIGVALNLFNNIQWVRNGVFASFLFILLGGAITLGGYAGVVFSRRAAQNGIDDR